MSGKSPFISEKISELRQKIARPCTRLKQAVSDRREMTAKTG